MAGIALPAGVRQRPLPFPRTPRLIAPPDRVVPWAVAALLFITAVLNFYIFQVSVVATSSYELQAIQRERDTWKARNEQLELELAKARSLRWVEYAAVTRLGMVRGESPLYIWVDAAAASSPTTVPDLASAANQPLGAPVEEPAQDSDAEASDDIDVPPEQPPSGPLGWLASILPH
jgi:hypothetical protein